MKEQHFQCFSSPAFPSLGASGWSKRGGGEEAARGELLAAGLPGLEV